MKTKKVCKTCLCFYACPWSGPSLTVCPVKGYTPENVPRETQLELPWEDYEMLRHRRSSGRT